MSKFDGRGKVAATIFGLLLFLLSATPVAMAEFLKDPIVTKGIWLDSRAYASLSDAVAAAGGNEVATILVADHKTVSSNLTIPANINLTFSKGGKITVTNSAILYLDTKSITSPHICFSTSNGGKIYFPSGMTVSSHWFASIADAIEIAGASGRDVTVAVTKAETLPRSVTCGDNVRFKWDQPGNVLTIPAGLSLANAGIVDAGTYQVFAGSGTLSVASGFKGNLEWFASLDVAVAWIGSATAELSFYTTIPVNSSLTVPSTLTLTSKSPGGKLQLANGVTLTFEGSQLVAGEWQVFTNLSSATILGLPEANGKWFGMSEESGDNYLALNKALAASKRLILPSGTYSYSTTLNITNDNQQVIGNGTVLAYSGSGYAVAVSKNGGVYDVRLSSLELRGTSNALGGLYLYANQRSVYENLVISGFSNGPGLYVYGYPTLLGGYGGSYKLTFINCAFGKSGAGNRYGVYIASATSTKAANNLTFVGCSAQYNTGDGVWARYSNAVTWHGGLSESNGGFGFNLRDVTYWSVFASHEYNHYVDIQDLSRANPCVVTWSNHDLETDDYVTISGVTGAWSVVNGTWKITKIDGSHFSIPVDTSGIGVAYDPDSDPGVVGFHDYRLQDVTQSSFHFKPHGGVGNQTTVAGTSRAAVSNTIVTGSKYYGTFEAMAVNLARNSSSGAGVLYTGVEGESYNSFQLTNRGRLYWGSGSSAYDLSFYRVGVNYGSFGADSRVEMSQLILTPLETEPANKTTGSVVCANRVDWDPLGIGSGGAYLVLWNGSSWVRVSP